MMVTRQSPFLFLDMKLKEKQKPQRNFPSRTSLKYNISTHFKFIAYLSSAFGVSINLQ